MKLFLISLASNTARRESAIAQAKRSGMDWELVDAIEADWVRQSWLDSISGKGAPNRWGMACVLSHLNALRRVVDYGLDRAVIVEDDWSMRNNLASLVTYLPLASDYITLSHLDHECAPVNVIARRVCDSFEELDSVPISTVGYIVSQRLAKRMLAMALPAEGHIDRIFRLACGPNSDMKVFRTLEPYVMGNDMPSILHHDTPA